jgi:hypothetical protein
MPPTPRRTPTRAERDAELVGAFLDQIWALLGGGPTTKDRNAHFARFKREAMSVVRRDNEPNVLDGYKSRHGDASGVGGNSEFTAVESPAFRLVGGYQPKDDLHAAAELIKVNAPKAHNHLVAISNQVRRVPAEPGAPTPEPAKCSHCQLEPGDRETDVNGALPGARFLGLWCIQFVEQQGTAGVGSTRRGWAARLPNDTEITAWQSGRKPRAHVDPKAAFGFNNADGTRSFTGATLNLPPSAA